MRVKTRKEISLDELEFPSQFSSLSLLRILRIHHRKEGTQLGKTQSYPKNQRWRKWIRHSPLPSERPNIRDIQNCAQRENLTERNCKIDMKDQSSGKSRSSKITQHYNQRSTAKSQLIPTSISLLLHHKGAPLSMGRKEWRGERCQVTFTCAIARTPSLTLFLPSDLSLSFFL